jgi:hypothetical protein
MAKINISTAAKAGRWRDLERTQSSEMIEKETQREKLSNHRGWDYLKKCGYS